MLPLVRGSIRYAPEAQRNTAELVMYCRVASISPGLAAE